MMEQYIIPPDQFQPANAYHEWKTVMETLDAFPEAVARASTWEKCDYNNAMMILSAISKHRSESQIYLWLHDIWQTATKGSDVAFEASEIAEEDMPDRIQYWSFNVDITLNAAGQKDLQVSPDFTIAGHFLIPSALILGRFAGPGAGSAAFVPALLLQPSPELMGRVNKDAEAGEPRPPEEYIHRFRFGEPVRAGKVVPLGDRGTLAAIRFLRDKIVEPRQQFLPRSDRRRAEKAGNPVPEIRTVLLRARATDMTSAMTDEQRKEYACHFLVSSHWRKPNRHMKDQRPVFVASYVKGDTEKPFRPPRETIYHVAR